MTDLIEGRSVIANRFIGTAGLIAAVGFVVVTFGFAIYLSLRALRRLDIDIAELQGRFVHSLVPIAIGYTVAHYFSLFVFQGQAGYILASDPLSQGDDLFGTSDWQIVYTVVSTAAIALVQSPPSSGDTCWALWPPTTGPWACSPGRISRVASTLFSV